MHCGINRVLEGKIALDVPNAIDFVVFGGSDRPRAGLAATEDDDRVRRCRNVSEAAANPELREVRGPSALGGGRQRFFDLLWLISVTEFKRVYFGTVLGYLWSLMRPLMLFGVLLFVFTQVFKVGSEQVEPLPGDAAARDRPLHLLPGIDAPTRSAPWSPRRAWSARPSSRAW